MAQTLDTRPFRDELLSIERLEERARALAARFTVDPSRRTARSVFPRFDENARLLAPAYRALATTCTAASSSPRGRSGSSTTTTSSTPRSGWCGRTCRAATTASCPSSPPGTRPGNARVYALAVELIRHSDSRLDRQQLARFLDGFQTVAPLTIGELWAWPSMLKLALIENLRRLAEETMAARAARRAADGYVERIDAAAPGRCRRSRARSTPPHVVQLLHRVREYGPRLSALRRDLDAHVARGGHSAEEAIRSEHQREAATQVSVANAITSLRLCAEIDWPQFVESVSLVERVLQRDPAGVHGRMDFLSRDRYRQAVEELAEPSGEAQVRVALRAVESGREAAEAEGQGARAAHVGHHLIGKGRRGLEADVAWRPGLWKGLRRLAFAHAASLYLAAISLATAGLVAAGVAYARAGGGSPRVLVVAALLLLLPASEFAIALVQRLAAHFAPPAAPSPARLRGRHPRGRADPGGHPDAARRACEGWRTSSRTWRCSRSGTSTPASTSPSWATSPTPRRGSCRRTPPSSRPPAAGSRRSMPGSARGGGPVLPAAPGAPVEPGRGRLDGLGAQARQAGGAEPPPARRDRHQLRGPGRDHGHLPVRAVLHHPRHRHPTAPRRRAQARRHHRPPAQPAPLRSAPAAG